MSTTWIADMWLYAEIKLNLTNEQVEAVLKEFHDTWPRGSEAYWRGMVITADTRDQFLDQIWEKAKYLLKSKFSPYPNKGGWTAIDKPFNSTTWVWKNGRHEIESTLNVTTSRGREEWTIPYGNPANPKPDQLAALKIRLEWREQAKSLPDDRVV